MGFVRFRSMASVCAMCGLLAVACGGGGSSGGDDDPTLSLNGGNAADVTGAVVRAVFVSAEIGEALGDGLPGGAGGGGAGAGAILRKAQGTRGGEVPEFSTRAPFGPDIVDCDVSGQVTISGDLADPVSVGDFVNADYDLCDDGILIRDGGVDITIDALTGVLFEGDFSATLGMTMEMLSIDDGVFVLTIDGDGDLSLDYTVPMVSTVGLSGSSLTLTDGVATATLTDYSTVFEVDEDAGTYLLTASGRMEHSDFMGSVDYDTETDLSGLAGDDPDDGLLVIFGALDTLIEVIPDANGVDVDLFVDLDGNGTPEELVETTWDDLFGG